MCWSLLGNLVHKRRDGKNYESDSALTGMIDCANRTITVEAKCPTGSFPLKGREYRQHKFTFLEGVHHQAGTMDKNFTGGTVQFAPTFQRIRRDG